MPGSPPADWYSDPFGRYERRYWDGSAWSEHVASAGHQAIDAPLPAPVTNVPEVPQHPAGWHADPFGRHQTRYWDGSGWTEHVASYGRQVTDPPVESAPPVASQPPPAAIPVRWEAAQPPPAGRSPVPSNSRAVSKIQKQVQKVGPATAGGMPDLAILNEPILVINQKGKLVELRAEYAVYDQNGRQVAAVQGKRMSSRMQVVDMAGRPLLELRREISLLSSKINITGPGGAKVGRIVPSMHINKVDRDFKLEGQNDELVGEVRREDLQRHRHRDFRIQDAAGTLIADISKTRAGLAKEMFTKGDNYVLHFSGSPNDQLRLLSVAAAIVIDTAFHQN